MNLVDLDSTRISSYPGDRRAHFQSSSRPEKLLVGRIFDVKNTPSKTQVRADNFVLSFADNLSRLRP